VGDFLFTFEALDAVPALSDKHLSHVCRTWPDESSVPEILTSNMAELARRTPLPTIPEKRDWLLELMGQRTRVPGSVSRFDGTRDYPLVTAQSADEVAFLMNALVNAKLLAGIGNGTAVVTMLVAGFGWRFRMLLISYVRRNFRDTYRLIPTDIW
jgi:hypothetical protein